MDFFNHLDLLEFSDKFRTNEDCKTYLANKKWNSGYNCKSCHSTFTHKSRDPFIRRCRNCFKTETSTSGTLFHNLKFDLRKAFMMVYIICNTYNTNTTCYNFARLFKLNKNTALLFEKKVKAAMRNKDEGIYQVTTIVENPCRKLKVE